MQILGISTDSVADNAAFAEKFDFPFPLLSDTNREVCKLYGACDSHGIDSAKRITYVIGPDGKIVQAYDKVNVEEQAETLLALPARSTYPVPQAVTSSTDNGVQIVQHDASAAPTSNKRRAVMQDEQIPAAESQLEATVDIVPDAGTDLPSKLDVQVSEDRTSETEAIISDLEADTPSPIMAVVEVAPDAATDPPSKSDVQVVEELTFEAEEIISDLEVDTSSLVMAATGVAPGAATDPPSESDVQVEEELTFEEEAIISDLEVDTSSAAMAAVEVEPEATIDPTSDLDHQIAEEWTFAKEAIFSDLEVDTLSPVTTTAESPLFLEHAAVSAPSQVQPAEVNSSGGSLVYALGTIGHDFGSEARMDAFAQAMGNAGAPQDSSQLVAHLADYPYEAASIIWTLSLDATPIYAIKPGGAFADVAYERLREFLNDQVSEGVQRVSIPGIVSGQTTLMSGQMVPTIMPALRGMYSWSTGALVEAVLGPSPEGEAEGATFEQKRDGISNFLERVYYELRNLGTGSQERAMNFAATNAFQITQVFETAVKDEMELDQIGVEASPICRPGSDCWDVKLVFFEPGQRLERARKVYRFTVDVSDVVPVTVGAVRSWSVY